MIVEESARLALPPPPIRVKTSGWAVASLVLGIPGFLLLPAIAGLVCDTAVVFELQSGGWNIAGGPELMRRPKGGGDRVIVGFVEGHLAALAPGPPSGGSTMGSLIRDPENP